jgi:membrane-associated protease RseP (regulator of RpoE activity)
VVQAGAPRAFLFGMRGEAEVDRLQVGDLTAEDVPVLVMDHPLLKAMGQILKRPIDGLVGYTFFARYKTTIDYQARRMTFEPVDFQVRNLMKDLPDRLAGPKIARHRVLAPVGLWGLNVGAPTGGAAAAGVPILAVLPGSPAAEAGLKPGDILTALDGRWTASVADAYTAAALAPSGRPVPVVVLRDGQELTLSVTPRPGI